MADDILVFGKGESTEEAYRNHDKALLQLLRRARKCNIKINKEKMRLHMTELLYIGHRISEEGIRPDVAKVAAIKGMVRPRSPSDIRRFLGMCNYLSRFIPRLSQASEPLRKLTESNTEFHWTSTEQEAFDEIKNLICQNQLLAYYDVNSPVVIQCDASGEGLGATLLQRGKPITSASRSLTPAEKNYVALELECLAIVFACHKFDQYIYGKKIRVETDHKPLESITRKSLLSAPRRLQRMLLSLQRYDLEVVYRPGDQQVIADTLSRLPVEGQNSEKQSQQEVLEIAALEEEANELKLIKEREFVRLKDQRLVEIQKAAAIDLEQNMLSKIIQQGWPDRIQQVPEIVKKYWTCWLYKMELFTRESKWWSRRYSEMTT